MKRTYNHRDDLDLNSQDELSEDTVETLVRHIQLMPEYPLPHGFVEEAMSNWRKSKRLLPSPVETPHLRLAQKAKIIVSQGLWRDVVLGVLLFVVGFLILSVSELVPTILILPVAGCIPLLVVIANTARHTLCGMGELSRSLRIPIHWYMQARLLFIGMVALLLNIIVIAVIFPAWGGEVLMRVALLWCIPTLMNAAIALMLSARIRSFGQLATVLVLLPIFWLILFSSESAITWTASIDLIRLSMLAILTMAMLVGTIIMNGRYLKRGGFLSGS